MVDGMNEKAAAGRFFLLYVDEYVRAGINSNVCRPLVISHSKYLKRKGKFAK